MLSLCSLCELLLMCCPHCPPLSPGRAPPWPGSGAEGYCHPLPRSSTGRSRRKVTLHGPGWSRCQGLSGGKLGLWHVTPRTWGGGVTCPVASVSPQGQGVSGSVLPVPTSLVSLGLGPWRRMWCPARPRLHGGSGPQAWTLGRGIVCATCSLTRAALPASRNTVGATWRLRGQGHSPAAASGCTSSEPTAGGAAGAPA